MDSPTANVDALFIARKIAGSLVSGKDTDQWLSRDEPAAESDNRATFIVKWQGKQFRCTVE
jgi:hypothetical protein